MKSRGISGAPWDVFGLLVVLVMICLGTHKAAGDDTTATPAAIDKDWWRKTAVYQIYPRSFYDLTNKDGTNVPDGIGDLKGIYSRNQGRGLELTNIFLTLSYCDNWLSNPDEKVYASCREQWLLRRSFSSYQYGNKEADRVKLTSDYHKNGRHQPCPRPCRSVNQKSE